MTTVSLLGTASHMPETRRRQRLLRRSTSARAAARCSGHALAPPRRRRARPRSTMIERAAAQLGEQLGSDTARGRRSAPDQRQPPRHAVHRLRLLGLARARLPAAPDGRPAQRRLHLVRLHDEGRAVADDRDRRSAPARCCATCRPPAGGCSPSRQPATGRSRRFPAMVAASGCSSPATGRRSRHRVRTFAELPTTCESFTDDGKPYW